MFSGFRVAWERQLSSWHVLRSLGRLGTPTFKLACSPVFEMKKDTPHARLKSGVPKVQNPLPHKILRGRLGMLGTPGNVELQFGMSSGNASFASRHRGVSASSFCDGAIPSGTLGTPTFKLACSPVFEMKKDTPHARLKSGVPKVQNPLPHKILRGRLGMLGTPGNVELQFGMSSGNASFASRHRGVSASSFCDGAIPRHHHGIAGIAA
ncbi:MAG: hypothetical protein BWX67_02330 [Thermotogae bacterium ADurb.Bin062]|nr:MAG: hypothetical protein BWX67_02330 [Thermotogota bacterium ADurb.Bin062]